MMRRLITLAIACLTLGTGLTAPAHAAWDWGTQAAPNAAQAPTAPQAPADAASHQTGWKMGRLPAASTLCIANGAADTGYAYEFVIEKINSSAYYPNISVLNRCDGYSIENRATIDWYVDGTTTCAKFTNTGRVWDPAQGYYVWNQNVVIWYNLSDYCVGEDTVRAHRTTMYVLYVLGLQYHSTSNVNACICSTSWCFYNVKYATLTDKQWLANIYGGEA